VFDGVGLGSGDRLCSLPFVSFGIELHAGMFLEGMLSFLDKFLVIEIPTAFRQYPAYREQYVVELCLCEVCICVWVDGFGEVFDLSVGKITKPYSTRLISVSEDV
jgi:hypothetical protein